LALELAVVLAVDRLHDLVGFLDDGRLQALVRLLAVPGTAPRRAQARDQLDEPGERGSCLLFGHGLFSPDEASPLPGRRLRLPALRGQSRGRRAAAAVGGRRA